MLFIITSINVKMPSKYTKETLIIEIEKIYGKGTYDISKMENPKRVNDKVTLICNKEGPIRSIKK